MLKSAYKLMILGGLFFRQTQSDVCIKKPAPHCRPSELPIYSESASQDPSPKVPQEPEINDTELHGRIERSVRTFRRKARCQLENFKAQNATWLAYYDEAVAETQGTIAYLREPDNTIPRCGAIMLGGASGFLCALRGGPIKRFIYSAIGAGAVASFCYPQAACDQAKVALQESQKAIAVAYDYIKRKKTGNELLDLKPVSQVNNNKFPVTLEDWRHFLRHFFTSKKSKISKQVDE